MKMKPEQWIVGEDTGLSSKTIWSVMMDVEFKMSACPSDPADFGRCYRLLQNFPEWRARLHEVSERHSHWKTLVDLWSECERIYERDIKTGSSTELAELLRNPHEYYSKHIVTDSKRTLRYEFEKTCPNFSKNYNEKEDMYSGYETQIRWESFLDGYRLGRRR